jgi:hypothetical protein
MYREYHMSGRDRDSAETAESANECMHETLAALEGLDQSDVETELDPETELEAARYWFEGDVEFEPSLTVSGGRSSLALGIPAAAEQVDPPSMEEERADPDEIREIGNHTGYTGYRTDSSSWNDSEYWQHVGYPGDLTGTQRPVFYGDGEIDTTQSRSTRGQSGTVMGHFMDVTGGHSGGPVWGWWDDELWPRVVGVQSAEAGTPSRDTAGDNEAGGGPALSRLIGYARDQYH